MKLIAIGGPKYSGKDTVADILVKKYGYTKMSIASTMKNFVHQCSDIPLNHFHQTDLKEYRFDEPISFDVDKFLTLMPPICPVMAESLKNQVNSSKIYSAREMLQFIGTDISWAYYGREVWINFFKEEYKKSTGKVVVSDVRTKAERDALRNMKAVIILIKNNRLTNTDSHITENDLGQPHEYHGFIENHGDKETLDINVALWYNIRKEM